jgi:hypothetical protein
MSMIPISFAAAKPDSMMVAKTKQKRSKIIPLNHKNAQGFFSIPPQHQTRCCITRKVKLVSNQANQFKANMSITYTVLHHRYGNEVQGQRLISQIHQQVTFSPEYQNIYH